MTIIAYELSRSSREANATGREFANGGISRVGILASPSLAQSRATMQNKVKEEGRRRRGGGEVPYFIGISRAEPKGIFNAARIISARRCEVAVCEKRSRASNQFSSNFHTDRAPRSLIVIRSISRAYVTGLINGNRVRSHYYLHRSRTSIANVITNVGLT